MKEFRKPPTESDIIERLKSGQWELPPLRFRLVRIEPRMLNNRRFDLEIEANWNNQKATFAVEYKAQSTPKAFNEAKRLCREAELPPDYLPMVVMPYLRESQLRELETLNVSGVDLCGNGVVMVPGRLLVYRTGAKNQFASYSPIKNIYRKNTSMVARAMLIRSRYNEVRELFDEVNRRNILVERWGKKAMSPGTVSKALKGMEDDLIVDRRDGVRLLQPDKLLELLCQNYEKPRITRRVKMKIDCGWKELLNLVRDNATQAMTPVAATGLASVGRYAVMQREEILSVYCPRGSALLQKILGNEESRFPNFELLETEDEPVFFDAREDDGFLWASPLQTYLELATGDKRDRETAELVQSYILKRLDGGSR